MISSLRKHLAERAADRELRRELAAYTTPAEIEDLLASVTGDDASARQVRTILHANLEAYHQQPRLAG